MEIASNSKNASSCRASTISNLAELSSDLETIARPEKPNSVAGESVMRENRQKPNVAQHFPMNPVFRLLRCRTGKTEIRRQCALRIEAKLDSLHEHKAASLDRGAFKGSPGSRNLQRALVKIATLQCSTLQKAAETPSCRENKEMSLGPCPRRQTATRPGGPDTVICGCRPALILQVST